MDNNPIFSHFDEGEFTRFQKELLFDPNAIWKSSDQDKFTPIDINDDIKYPRDLLEDEGNLFIKGVYNYFKEQFNITIENNKQLIYEIRSRYKSKGIFDGENFKDRFNTIEKWFSDTNPALPSRAQSYRENCYLFCIALDMDVHTTAEFLFKKFKIMPFNYKNRIDAVYFYSILNHKDYKTIKELKEKALKISATNNSNVYTSYLGRTIMEIDNDKEFLSFLECNSYDPKHQFETAKKAIEELIAEDCDLANKSHNRPSKKVKSYDGLLEEMAGYSHNKRAGGGISSAKNLPKEFSQSFPEVYSQKELENMSDEKIRKLLIILKFYQYYKQAEIHDFYKGITSDRITPKEIKGRRDDFLKELNVLLSECGYVELYPCNFFDWYIFCFIKAHKPLVIMRKIIDEEVYGKLHNEA